MTRQRPFADDIATGTPTSGYAPLSTGPGAPPAWGAVSAGGGGGGGWTLIEKRVLSGTTAAPVSFTSIPQTFEHLLLLGDLRFTTNGNSLFVRVNSEIAGTTNWSWTRMGSLQGNTNVVVDGYLNGAGEAIVGFTTGGAAPAGAAALLELFLPAYSQTVFYKKLRGFLNQMNTVGQVNDYQTVATRKLSDAITDLHIWASTGSFAVDSTFWLYGWGSPVSNYVGCVLNDSGVSSIGIPTATSVAIPWDTEDIDNGSFHEGVTNPSRVTIPAGEDGGYVFSGLLRLPFQDPTKEWFAAVRLNGADYRAPVTGNFSDTQDTDIMVSTPPLLMAAGDWAELVIRHNAGVTVTVSPTQTARFSTEKKFAI